MHLYKLKKILITPSKIKELVTPLKAKKKLGIPLDTNNIYEIDEQLSLKIYHKYHKYVNIKNNDIGTDGITNSTFISQFLGDQVLSVHNSYFYNDIGYKIIDTVKYNLDYYIKFCKKQKIKSKFPLVVPIKTLLDIFKQVFLTLFKLKETYHFSANRVISSNIIVFDEEIDIHYQKVNIHSKNSYVLSNMDFAELKVKTKKKTLNFFRMDEVNEYPVFIITDEYYKFESWTSFTINEKSRFSTPLVWDFITFNTSLLLNPHIYYQIKNNRILKMAFLDSWVHPEDLIYFTKKIEQNIKKRVEITYNNVLDVLKSIRFAKNYHQKVMNILPNL